MKRDRLAIERGVLGRRRRAEMRLQRDVAEILEAEDAEVSGVIQDARHRQRHRAEAGRATRTNGS